MLEGKLVNLRVMEKDDLSLYAEWLNDPDFYGPFVRLKQKSKAELEKQYDTLPQYARWFLIEKKDGSKIGYMVHFCLAEHWEIGYALILSERNKGYCTEAVVIMVDYLFLSRDIVRIQVRTDARNVASQRVLEKVGFTKEGTLRKSWFVRGEYRDMYLYSILKDEWKELKILTKTKS